jgi:predicted metal-dependent hydrolase
MTKAALQIPIVPFEYETVRSRRKTLVVYVREGRVQVRAPLRASSVWINDFLRNMAPWVQSQLTSQRLKLRERLVIDHDRLVTFLGETRRIQVVLSNQQKVVLKGSNLYIYSRDNSSARLEKLFNNWLQEQAREYMVTQTIKVARRLGVEHKLKDVSFRRTKSKWGHCCEDGTIQYNWLAMMAPREVVNYLVAHETSHLRFLNHSDKFWQTVASVCPGYKDLRDWLTHNGHRFWTRSA